MAALTRLGRGGMREHVPAIVACLEDGDPLVRREAVFALMALGARETLPRMEPHLADPDWRVRVAMAGLLAQQGDTYAARIVALLRDADPRVGDSLIELIARMKAPMITQDVSALLEDPEAHVRTTAIRVLMKRAARAASDAIAGRLDDPDVEVRRMALLALGELRATEQAPAIERLLDDPQTATVASNTLARLGVTGYGAHLQQVVATSMDPMARAAAAEAMGGETTDTAVLSALLNDASPGVREHALAAIARHHLIGTAPQVVELLGRTGDFNERLKAIEVLAQLDDRNQAGAITALLRRGPAEYAGDAGGSVVRSSTWTEQEPGGMTVTKSASWTDMQDPAVRGPVTEYVIGAAPATPQGTEMLLIAALEACGRLKAGEQAPELSTYLEYPALRIRTATLYALGEMENPEMCPRIAARLQDEDPGVRNAALWALVRLRGTEQLLALEHEGAPTPEEHLLVLYALASVHDARTVPLFLSASQDPNADIRCLAISALEDFQTPETAARLRAMRWDIAYCDVPLIRRVGELHRGVFEVWFKTSPGYENYMYFLTRFIEPWPGRVGGEARRVLTEWAHSEQRAVDTGSP